MAEKVDLSPASTIRQSPQPIPSSVAPPMSSLGWLDSKPLSWLPAISFAFMTYTSIDAVYKSWPDPGTISFVVGTYTILLLLFWSMRAFEKIRDRKSPQKEMLKVAVWMLAMILNVMFSYRVTVLLDSTVMSAIVWTIAGTTAIGGFYILFLYKEKTEAAASATKGTGK